MSGMVKIKGGKKKSTNAGEPSEGLIFDRMQRESARKKGSSGERKIKAPQKKGEG